MAADHVPAWLDTLNAIPKELWTPLGVLAAALLGALIAFIGVMLQNRSATRRHRRELEHDAEQRRLEREADLRKVVYLEALEQLAKIPTALLAVVNPSVPPEEIRDLVKQIGSSGWKLYGIAGMDTIRALEAANRQALNVTIPLGSARVGFTVAKGVSDIIEQSIKDDDARQETLRGRLSALDLGDEERNKLMDESERLRLSLIERRRQNADVSATLTRLTMDTMLAAVDAAIIYNRQVWRLILEIRKEIGFALDEQEFLRLMEASAQDFRRAASTLVTGFKQLAEKIAGAGTTSVAAPGNKPTEAAPVNV